MGLSFTTLVYQSCYDTFAVDCTFVTAAGGTFTGRGIFHTGPISVLAEFGSVISDQQTTFDIREAEVAFIPQQLDYVIIPFDCNDAPLGEFEITDVSSNGGGETTLTLRKPEVKDGT
jgi:hypothetical protein